MSLSEKNRRSFFERLKAGMRPLLLIAPALLCFSCARTPDVRRAAQNDAIQAEIVLSRYRELNQPEFKNYLDELNFRLQSVCQVKPAIQLLAADEPFAFSSSSGIIAFSSGLVSKLNNEAEFFFVLAHEAAHIALGHAGFPAAEMEAEVELEADRAALRIMTMAGYDPAASLTVLLKTYRHVKPEDITRLKYPAFEQRLTALQKLSASNPVTFAIRDRRDFRVFKAELLRIAGAL